MLSDAVYRVETALEPVSGSPNTFRADNFDTLVDSPIIAGNPVTREFTVDGKRHVVANFRVIYRHRPGSDFIVALNEERGVPGSISTLVERHLALKLNYLARF